MTTLRFSLSKFSLSKFSLTLLAFCLLLLGAIGGAGAQTYQTPPTKTVALLAPISASLAADGQTITLHVFHPASAGLLPASSVTGFSVMVNGTASTLTTQAVSASYNDALLVLSTAAPAGATVTVSYASGNVTDAASDVMAAFSAFAVSDERAAFVIKTTIVNGAATAVGAANNTTSVPGFMDSAGNAWNIISSPSIGNYVIQSPSGGYSRLYMLYPSQTPNLDQQVTIVTAPGNANRWSVILRDSILNGNDFLSKVYLNLSGAIAPYYSSSSGGLTSVTASPSVGMNNTDQYKWVLTVAGAGEATVFTATVTDFTTGAAVNFNAGTNTWSTPMPLGNDGIGTLFLAPDTGSYVSVAYADRVPPTTLISTLSATSQTRSVIALAATAAGGVPPYTIAYYATGFYGTPSAGNLLTSGSGGVTVSNGGLLMTQTGLAANTMQQYTCVITDSAATKVTAYQAVPTLKSAIQDQSISFYQIGDSITQGGSPNSIFTAAAMVQTLLGRTTAIPSNSYGISGTTSAGLTDSTQLSTIASAINTAVSTDVFLRIGINDTDPVTTVAGNILTIAQYVLANCSTVRAVWVLPTTYRPFLPSVGGDPTPQFARARAYQSAVQSITNGTTIRWLTTADFDTFEARPDLSSDGTHPTQAGYNLLGTMDGAAWFGSSYAPIASASILATSGQIKRGR